MDNHHDDERLTAETLEKFNSLIKAALSLDTPIFHSEIAHFVTVARQMSRRQQSSRL